MAMNFLDADTTSTMPSYSGAGALNFGGGAGDAGGGGGGGWMDAINKIVQNKLLWQYMGGVGSAMQKGEPIGPALNDITMKNISAQNYAALLKKALGPDDTKATFSKAGVKVDIPQSALSTPITSMMPESGSSPLPPQSSSVNSSQLGTLNPFADSRLGSLTASDLAGLTPEDIHSALGVAMTAEQLKRKSVLDAADIAYKGAHTKLFEAQASEHVPSITVPGTDIKLTRDEWINWKKLDKENQTNSIKEYEYAVKKDGYKGTFTDFENLKTTEHQKDYKAAVAGGYKGSFNNWLVEMKKAGATNISLGDKLAERKAFGGLEGQLYFTKGDYVKDLNKHMEKSDFANVPGKAGSPEYKANVSKAKVKEKVKFIEDGIVGRGGEIVGVNKIGNTGVWTVKWPDGTKTEIKNALDE